MLSAPLVIAQLMKRRINWRWRDGQHQDEGQERDGYNETQEGEEHAQGAIAHFFQVAESEDSDRKQTAEVDHHVRDLVAYSDEMLVPIPEAARHANEVGKR